MDKIFLTIINMSLTGAFVIAGICLARIPLRKSPKIIPYMLWAVAGFRLIFPFSFNTVWSLMPFKAQPIPMDITTQQVPRIESGVTAIDNLINSVLPVSGSVNMASVNPLEKWTVIASYVWLLGAAVMIAYGVASYVMLKRKMNGAVHVEGNIYETEIETPFVLGIHKPRIYIPLILSVQERGYIILHEQTHIRRCDHYIKIAAFFILCLHWFNPFAWVAFLLMSVDMEMSCDECVIKKMGGSIKKDYSRSLLSLGTQRRIIGSYPLAFGMGNINDRVKNVLNFKKRSSLTIMLAVAFTVILSIGFAGNRISGTDVEAIGFFLDETITDTSQSEQHRKKMLIQAKQIELAEAITRFNGVNNAYVNLTIQELSDSFTTDEIKTAASVLLIVDRLITEEEGLTMARFIMRSVEGLEFSNIEIIDNESHVVFSGMQ